MEGGNRESTDRASISIDSVSLRPAVQKEVEERSLSRVLKLSLSRENPKKAII